MTNAKHLSSYNVYWYASAIAWLASDNSVWYATGPVASVAGMSDNEDKSGTAAEQDEPLTVEVPQIDDDELSSFFITSLQHQDQCEREEASVDTFNDIFIDSNDMYALMTE